MARPSSFTQDLADAICGRLIEGESLRRICKRPGFPNASTVCRWLADGAHRAFREQYAHAREAQADTLADEILYIADTPQFGVVTTKIEVEIQGEVDPETGEPVPKVGVETRTKRGDMLGHRRLRMDARRWYSAKLNPKKYGEKVDVNGAVALTLPTADVMGDEDWSREFAGET